MGYDPDTTGSYFLSQQYSTELPTKFDWRAYRKVSGVRD